MTAVGTVVATGSGLTVASSAAATELLPVSAAAIVATASISIVVHSTAAAIIALSATLSFGATFAAVSTFGAATRISVRRRNRALGGRLDNRTFFGGLRRCRFFNVVGLRQAKLLENFFGLNS